MLQNFDIHLTNCYKQPVKKSDSESIKAQLGCQDVVFPMSAKTEDDTYRFVFARFIATEETIQSVCYKALQHNYIAKAGHKKMDYSSRSDRSSTAVRQPRLRSILKPSAASTDSDGRHFEKSPRRSSSASDSPGRAKRPRLSSSPSDRTASPGSAKRVTFEGSVSKFADPFANSWPRSSAPDFAKQKQQLDRQIIKLQEQLGASETQRKKLECEKKSGWLDNYIRQLQAPARFQQQHREMNTLIAQQKKEIEQLKQADRTQAGVLQAKYAKLHKKCVFLLEKVDTKRGLLSKKDNEIKKLQQSLSSQKRSYENTIASLRAQQEDPAIDDDFAAAVSDRYVGETRRLSEDLSAQKAAFGRISKRFDTACEINDENAQLICELRAENKALQRKVESLEAPDDAITTPRAPSTFG